MSKSHIELVRYVSQSSYKLRTLIFHSIPIQVFADQAAHLRLPKGGSGLISQRSGLVSHLTERFEISRLIFQRSRDVIWPSILARRFITECPEYLDCLVCHRFIPH